MSESLRESLENAFDEVESQEQGEDNAEGTQEELLDETEETGEEEKGASKETLDEPGGDELLGEADGGDELGDKESGDEEPEDTTSELEERPSTTDVKAPNSWKATGRDVWKDVPEAARAEIMRRESDMGRLMNDSAQHRKTAEGFQQAVQPFLSQIQAEGVSPPQAVYNLLQTAASLQGGSALVKAQTITRLIGAYGVDIQTLSDVLTDKHEPSEEDRVNAQVDARMAPFNAQQQQQAQQAQQYEADNRAQIRAETDVWTQSAEFITEVGADMADLLEMAGTRNQELTLQDAYDKACRMNPEVHKIITQRAGAEKAKERAKANKSKRKAGSSVSGTVSGSPGAMQNNSLRGALEAAWDEAEGE